MTRLGDNLPPEKIIKFVRSHNSENTSPHFDDNVGRFQEYVKDDPDAFSQLRSEIIELHPDFVYAFFAGIRDAAKQEQSIDWTPVLSLCEQIMGLESESRLHRHGIIRTIVWTVGFGMEKCSINCTLKDRVWEMLKPLAISEYGDQSIENTQPSKDKNTFIIAIDTQIGSVFNSIISCACWCSKHIENNIIVNEVIELISKYLDRRMPASVFIHTILGYRLSGLYLLDKDWIKHRLDQLFSNDCKSLSKFAWYGYLQNNIYKDVFVDLVNKYSTHIKELRTPILNNGELLEADKRVIQHVAGAYLFKNDRSEGLFCSMVLNSHDSVISYCAWHIGRTLSRQGDVAGIHPEAAIEFLNLLIEMKREIFRYHDTEYNLKELLCILLNDARTKNDAAALVDQLIEFGFDKYEDLLE